MKLFVITRVRTRDEERGSEVGRRAGDECDRMKEIPKERKKESR